MHIRFMITFTSYRASPGGDHIMGRALYDFHSNRTDEISFSTGDMIVSRSLNHVL